jgi:hypothetical protein
MYFLSITMVSLSINSQNNVTVALNLCPFNTFCKRELFLGKKCSRLFKNILYYLSELL